MTARQAREARRTEPKVQSDFVSQNQSEELDWAPGLSDQNAYLAPDTSGYASVSPPQSKNAA
jgi:hypothetical protein